MPQVELEWFLQYALPGLRAGLDCDKILQILERDPDAVKDDRWAMFSAYLMSAAEEGENDAFKPLTKLSKRIRQAADKLGHVQETVKLLSIATKSPESTTRENTSQPDAAAVLVVNYGKEPDLLKWVDVAIAAEFKKDASDAHGVSVSVLV